MTDSSIRIDTRPPSTAGSSLSLQRGAKSTTSTARSNVALSRSRVAFSKTSQLSEAGVAREKDDEDEQEGEEDEGEDVPDADAKSVISYEEYEDEEALEVSIKESAVSGLRRPRIKSDNSPRRALSLKAAAATAAAFAAVRAMSKKSKKVEKVPTKDKVSADVMPEVEGSVIGVGELRERMIRDMQEEIRLEQYYEKQRLLAEAEDAGKRQTQLEKTRSVYRRHEVANEEYVRSIQQDENWTRYMTCDSLPDPGSLSDMNTFLYLWSTKDEEASMDTVEESCRVVTNLLHKLDKIVRHSAFISKEYAAECEVIGAALRAMLQRWIDLACYHLLRNIEANMIREDTKTTRYVRTTNKAICCVWAPIPLPVGMKRRAAERERMSFVGRKSIEVEFEELRLTIKMPPDMDCHRMAIRGLWLAFDHYSMDANSYRIPDLPDHLLNLWDPSLNLLRFTRYEYEEKLRIREEQAEERKMRLEEKKAILERMENPPVSPKADKKKKGKKPKQRSGMGKQSDYEAMMETILPAKSDLLPYLPSPVELVYKREEEARSEARRCLFTRCEKTEVNLRKYRILGGVFRLDLMYQPPQPKDLGKDTSLTTLQLPKEPRFVSFFRVYEPPEPLPDDVERTPEMIEAEMKALESAMDILILVTLQLPESIFWFEPPVIAHWLPDKRIWSTKHIHDVKYNEEKQNVSFRSGRLGIHGLAVYKYSNIPFQSWELKPETGKSGAEYGGVVLIVTAATVQAEFILREEQICLNSFTGASTTPLEGILGKYTDLETLIEHLQQVGCDLFPDRDAASYLKGLSVKHPVAEKHLCECMALLSTSYAFSWSRWNATREYREIVVQFKEVHGCVAKERTNLTLLVTPLRTMRVRCTEVSPEFSSLPLEVEDSEFYADLYQLAQNTAGIKSRLLMERMSYKLVLTVTRLLGRTNVVSMST